MSNQRPPRPAAPAPAEVNTETAPEVVTETTPTTPEEALPGGLGLTSQTTVETKRGIVIETNNAVEGSAGWPVVESTETKVGGTVVETFIGTRPDTPWAGTKPETAE